MKSVPYDVLILLMDECKEKLLKEFQEAPTEKEKLLASYKLLGLAEFHKTLTEHVVENEKKSTYEEEYEKWLRTA